jgi:diguanylate cyclase (GGDEF)-like protein
MGGAPRILVVVGDTVEAAACELALATGLPGCAVAVERSARDGVAAMREGSFDVVVAGADLPGGHGLDVVRALTADEDCPPVVAVLGAGSERLAVAALAAGAEDALVGGDDRAMALADSVALAHGRALHRRRRRGLIALGERLEAEHASEGVLEAAVAGLALLLGADAVSAWLSSPAGTGVAHLAAPPETTPDALATRFEAAPASGEAHVLLPDHASEPALVWAASGPDDLLLAVRRSDQGWPPDDERWLVLAAHAVLGALGRVLERERTRDEADGDEVTGLPGERRFRAALAAEAERVRRQPAPVAVLLLELDRLAEVRSRFGEKVENAVVREAGEAVARSVRGYDLAARVAEHGFGVLLPAADRTEAEVVARRIHRSIAAIEFPAVGRVSVSLGLAAYPAAVDAVPDLLEAAERALDEGRRRGDAVVAAPSRHAGA